jgi:hypothetical protein
VDVPECQIIRGELLLRNPNKYLSELVLHCGRVAELDCGAGLEVVGISNEPRRCSFLFETRDFLLLVGEVFLLDVLARAGTAPSR